MAFAPVLFVSRYTATALFIDLYRVATYEQVGSVEIPQEAFLAILQVDDK